MQRPLVIIAEDVESEVREGEGKSEREEKNEREGVWQGKSEKECVGGSDIVVHLGLSCQSCRAVPMSTC